MRSAGLFFAVLALLAAARFPALIADNKPRAAVRMTGIFNQLEAAERSRAAGKPKKVAFELTETEVNDYLAWSLKTTPRPGLDGLRLKFFPGNYVSSYSVVDFDAVERWNPGTVPALLKPVLSGKRAIWVDLRFQAEHGQMTFTVEKAYLDSLPVPAFVVAKVIQVVAARQPEHYDTTRPIPLEYGIQRVWTGQQTLSGET